MAFSPLIFCSFKSFSLLLRNSYLQHYSRQPSIFSLSLKSIRLHQQQDRNMRKLYHTLIIVASLSFYSFALYAQAPGGNYYQNADGKKGQALKTALFHIIANHTAVSYKDIWAAYETTDMRDDGYVYDIYSNVTNYRYKTDQAGNYKKEGDVYNREHTMPKSWFNDATPMYTDLFHIMPSDGYVNSKRSNYPFGETKGEKYKSQNAYSKLGTCTTTGYSGIVFEPNDEYKGDLARNYFYMATAYEDKIGSWNSNTGGAGTNIFSGNSYTAYVDWQLDMLLRWAEKDPVSEKETKRNNAVFAIQHNRNPYIDYPGLEQYVWGGMTDVAFSYDHYDTNIRWKETNTTAIRQVQATNGIWITVYALDGHVVLSHTRMEEAIKQLPRGIYIANKRKFVVW